MTEENRRGKGKSPPMNRKHRTILLVVAFWGVTLGVPDVWLWRADRQERLNRQLISAIQREDTPAALLALERGADANARDEPRVPTWQRLWDLARGRRAARSTAPTALLVLLLMDSVSSYKEKPELVSALLLHGAQVNALDQNGSPLFYAFTEEDMRTAELLREHGADINGQNGSSQITSLGMAVFTEDTAAVRLLLRYHADPNTPMSNIEFARNPLEYAERNHLTIIAHLLRAAGAKK